MGRSHLPLSEALAFSWLSIRLRLGRLALVVLAIAFAIAFLAVLLGAEMALGRLQEIAARRGGQEEDLRAFRRWWIVVALLITTAGITNAVLMSITERIQEIGTLKCLGARGLHIVQIFLFEMLFLGGVGGLLGGLLGVLATLALFGIQLGSDLGRVFNGWDALSLMGISVAASLLLSLVSAVIPVFIAAKIEPAEAMRYEV